ncbi:MAG TPA: oligosaccharide flippase family protein [Flavitalea sp.]|nr:oligosaccharide flippase family protein [Flavitalea sp.]
MSRKFLQNISATFTQLAINQIFGLLVFYLLSRYLNKHEFGEINWSLAVYLTSFSILSFGLEQIIVRKIASSEDPAELLSIHFLHVVITGIGFYGLLLLAIFLFPNLFNNHPFLIMLGAAKLMLFFSSPFKQVVTGKEQFNLLTYMMVTSNIIKGILLACFAISGHLTVSIVLLCFIAGDLAELLVTLFLFTRFFKLRFVNPGNKKYRRLLAECIPQAGVVFFAALLSRIDWVMIGFLLPVSRLAEYGFAYKIFELSTLPLLVVAPLLLPMFSRQSSKGEDIYSSARNQHFIRLEFVIAALTGLLLNICWVPLMEPLTKGQYSVVNSHTVLILSFAIPLLYLNNYLWTIRFSEKRTNRILKIFMITVLVNVLANTVMIPKFGNEGAAISYVVAILIQTILYSHRLKENFSRHWAPMIICMALAVVSGVTAKLLFTSFVYVLVFSVTAYMLSVIICSQIRIRELKTIIFSVSSRKQPLKDTTRI